MNGDHPALLSTQTLESLKEYLRDRAARPVTRAGPGGRDRRPPLSSGQRRLWFIDQLAPGTVAYNVSSAYRLRGRLDINALEQALAAVVDRHEALRTHYEVVGGEPVQVIDDPGGFRLARSDLSVTAEPAQAARALALTDAETSFNLARGPLSRARLIRLSPDDHLLSIVVHHSVFDRESLEIWTGEVSAGYAAYRSGSVPEYPRLPAQYADFAMDQHARLAGRDSDRHVAYWRHRLAGAPAVLELPVDKPRPPLPSYRAGVISFTAPPHLTTALRRLAAGHGATLFMVTLAAYQALLSKHVASTDIVVGFPVSGRWQVRFETTVGFFANSVPVRASLAADPPFTALLNQVREAILDSYDHVELPFERIVEALAPPRDLGRNPVIQLWFNMIDSRLSEQGGLLSLPGVEVSRVDTGKARTRFDLELHLVSSPGGELAGRVLYATDLYEVGTITRFVRHYSALLRAIARDPEMRLSRMPILAADEVAQIVQDWGTASAANR